MDLMENTTKSVRITSAQSSSLASRNKSNKIAKCIRQQTNNSGYGINDGYCNISNCDNVGDISGAIVDFFSNLPSVIIQ